VSQRRSAPRAPVRPAHEDPFVVLPPPLAWAIVVGCVLPSLLILFGFDLGTDVGPDQKALRGTFIHTLSEWTAVCVAGMTALLALLHFRNTRNPITPVLFVGLLAAACADMGHTLLSDPRLGPVLVEARVVPMSWGLGRIYFAAILIVGVASRLVGDPSAPPRSADRAAILRLIGLGGAVSSLGLLVLYGSYRILGGVDFVFPQRLLTHPLDAVPLGLLLIGALSLFPALHRRAPSIFSHSLLLMTLPAVATQIHMAFGSRELYDAHFNAAHFLKVVTYFVPLVGLAFDYARTYERNVMARVRLENEMRVRRDMQDQLWGTEAANEAVLASVGDAIVTVDAAGRIEVFNPAAETMFGYDVAEAVGRPATVLAHEEWRPALGALVDRSGAADDAELLSTGFEMTGVRSDGSSFPVELTIGEFEVEGLVRCALVLRDMTERRRASEALAAQADQLRIRTEELQRSNQELEKFAYVASHDLQEPLRMVRSFTDLLAEELDDTLDATTREYIGFVRDGVGRMRTMIADLLTFSRVGGPTSEHGPMELDAAVERALANLHGAITDAEAIVHTDPLPRVRADLAEVAQVLQNLIGNAVKFRGDAIPEVHISAERRGASVCVSVQDNGIGIDMQYADRIFVLFQRLHPQERYPGTGIGLALCRKIVERYGGEIQVESALGEGSTFRFTLPAA